MMTSDEKDMVLRSLLADVQSLRNQMRGLASATGAIIGQRRREDWVPSGGMPGGTDGDILYWDHTTGYWKTLAAPTGFTYDPILRHNGTEPYWDEPSACP